MSKKLTIRQQLDKDLNTIQSKYGFPLGHDLNREKQQYRARYLRPIGAPGEGGKDTRKDSPHEGVIYKQRGDENWNIIMGTVEADSRKAYEIRQKINAIDGNIIHGIRRTFSRTDAKGRNRFQLQHENYLKKKGLLIGNTNKNKESVETGGEQYKNLLGNDGVSDPSANVEKNQLTINGQNSNKPVGELQITPTIDYKKLSIVGER